MALEMRPVCEKCNAGLAHDGEAYICSYECTFCKSCTEAMHHLSQLRRRTGASARRKQS